MRRKDRQITETGEIEKVLMACEDGFLATCGDDGQPLATPMNYVYENGRVFFHCATSGRKLDNIRQNSKVGFTVAKGIEIDREMMTTYYTSVMIEGTARIVEDPSEKKRVIELITRRLAAPGEECGDKEGKRTFIVEILVERMSGKTNKRKS